MSSDIDVDSRWDSIFQMAGYLIQPTYGIKYQFYCYAYISNWCYNSQYSGNNQVYQGLISCLLLEIIEKPH